MSINGLHTYKFQSVDWIKTEPVVLNVEHTRKQDIKRQSSLVQSDEAETVFNGNRFVC